MGEINEDRWIRWDPNNPPPSGTVIRLKFVNKVISNPITIVDGRGLGWDHHGHTWAKSQRLQRMNGLHIAAYQILEKE